MESWRKRERGGEGINNILTAKIEREESENGRRGDCVVR